MNCVEFRCLQNEYLDGRLSNEQRNEAEEHVRTCSRCRTGVDLLLLFRRSLQESRSAAPVALESLVMGSVNRALQRESIWKEWVTRLRNWKQHWELKFLFSKLVAAPVTMFFFALILAQFSSAPGTAWYPVYLSRADSTLNSDSVETLQLSYAPMAEFAENSSIIPDDSFVVLTRLNKDGVPTLEKILVAPNHELLLRLYSNRMEAIRCRPLLLNGNAQDSFIIVPYQKISVVG